jgi:hypothetical protein
MFRSKTESASRAVSAAVLLASLLAGCSDLYFDRRETITFDGGNSVAANAAEQTIDPWPRHSNNNRLAFNGQRMQHAVECYRIGKVQPPADIDPTTDGSSSLVPPPPPASCDATLQAINGNNASQWSSNGSTNSVGNALSTALGGGNSQSK